MTNISIRRFLISSALFVLPSVEGLMVTIERVIARLDTITDLIEQRLRTEAIHLGELAHNRAATLGAIERAYDAADKQALDTIASTNAKLKLASDARIRVAAALELR